METAKLGDEQDMYCDRPEEYKQGVIVKVVGVPVSHQAAYRFSDEAQQPLIVSIMLFQVVLC